MVPARIRSALARPGGVYRVAVVAVLLLAPTIGAGFAIDDYFHLLAVQGRFGVPIGPLDLFRFMPRDFAERAYLREIGFAAWWFPASSQISYFRPLASLWHYVDYRLWPGAPWLMHMENLLLYAGLVIAAGEIYRRQLGPPWVAGLAAALYAFDHSHGGPVGWIANRNAILSALLGVLSLLAHQTWRERGRAPDAAASAALLALSLLSAESGVAIVGYVAAYAAFLDRGSLRARAASLAPCALVVVAWRVGYRALGYGIVHSGISADPLGDPGPFVRRAVQSVPIQMASDVVGIPADPLVAAAPHLLPRAAAAALVVLAALVAAAWPLLRGDRPARFFASGALMSALPLGATLPTDRYLFWTGLGLMGLIARLCGEVDGGAGPSAARATRWIAGTCLVIHGIASPLLLPMRAFGFAALHDNYERVVATLPDDPAISKKTLVLVNAPNDLVAAMLPVLQMARGAPVAAHTYLLYSGLGDVEVTRAGLASLELTSHNGWLASVTDRTLRSTPFAVGQHVELDRMRVDVLAVTPDARAARVRFTFPERLEDPSLVFVTWGLRGLSPVQPPALGTTTIVPAAPLLVVK
ncbi:MAG TPA: hypothetical protein VKU41_29100 [Polyangiaceae bacterium]|nr:hypothetical protein [Polyangiaceae bacterium]